MGRRAIACVRPGTHLQLLSCAKYRTPSLLYSGKMSLLVLSILLMKMVQEPFDHARICGFMSVPVVHMEF